MSQVQVNNVPTSASPEELRQLFAQLGPVKSLLMSQEANKAEGTVRGLRDKAGRQGGPGYCVPCVRSGPIGVYHRNQHASTPLACSFWQLRP